MAVNRSCARPQCRRSATASLTYAYAQAAVWIEDLADEDHPMVHDLCEDHADNLAVPRGWELRDERTTTLAPAVGATRTEAQQLLSA